jgi:hypothetical protein
MAKALALAILALAVFGASPAKADETRPSEKSQAESAFHGGELPIEELESVRGVGVDAASPVSSQEYEQLSVILWDELGHSKPRPAPKQNGQMSSSISGSMQ